MRRTHGPLLALALTLTAREALAQTAPETGATRPVETQVTSSAPPTSGPSGQPASVTADFGRGVTFRTLDERFSLNVRAMFQARLTLAEQPGLDVQTEFLLRRMRLMLQGNMLGAELRYYVELGFANSDTEPDNRVPVLDAHLTSSHVRDLNVRLGQMKVPFGRQRVVAGWGLQMVERSPVVQELSLDRDVGVTLFSRDLFGLGHRIVYQLGLFGGDGRNRFSANPGMLYVARLQCNPMGEYEETVEADLQRLRSARLSFGAAVAYNQNSARVRSTTGDVLQRGFDYVHANVDVQFKLRGFSFQAEFIYRRADADSHDLGMNAMGTPLREYSRSGSGYYLQAGYLFNAHAELSARWGELMPFTGTDPRFLRLRELGGALSWYFQRHDFKLQADYFYLSGESFADGHSQARIQAQVFF